MTFLPIVGRELRVAARRRWTYWSRSSAALLALVLITFGFFTWDNMGLGQAMLAQQLFAFLSILTLLFCLVEGARQTADCLSGEKREGTLGLLFLTDLRGVDVVFGKFAAASLSSAQGLLAMLPILGLPLLLGGITAGEFWRMVLALLNALFFSLCAGMWVSARSREEARAVFGALGLTALFCLGLPLVETIVRQNTAPLTWLLSPLGPFNGSDNNNYSFSPFLAYWLPLLVTNGLGWLFLLLAAHRTGRHWREAMDVREAPESRWSRLWRGNKAARKRHQRVMLQGTDCNPVIWLATRRQILPHWWLAGAVGLLLLAGWLMGQGPMFVMVQTIVPPIAWMTFLGCKITASWMACRFLVEARQTGALELWLCTPLTLRLILDGAWQAFRRLWLFTVYLALGMMLMAGTHYWTFQEQWAEEIMAFFGGLGAAMPSLPAMMRLDYKLLELGANCVIAISDVWALFWVGTWLALTTRSLANAMFRSFLILIFLPGLALGLAQLIAMFTMSVQEAWPGIALVVTLFYNGMLAGWARRNLEARFREIASVGHHSAVEARLERLFSRRPRRAAPPPLPTAS